MLDTFDESHAGDQSVSITMCEKYLCLKIMFYNESF